MRNIVSLLALLILIGLGSKSFASDDIPMGVEDHETVLGKIDAQTREHQVVEIGKLLDKVEDMASQSDLTQEEGKYLSGLSEMAGQNLNEVEAQLSAGRTEEADRTIKKTLNLLKEALR